MERASGSGGFSRSPDTLFTMSSDDNKEASEEKEFVVDIDVRSFPPIKRFGIKYDFPIFKLDNDIDLTTKSSRGNRESKYSDEEFLSPLRVNSKGLQNTQWFNVMNGARPHISKSTFDRRVRRFLREDRVTKDDEGYYKDVENIDVEKFRRRKMTPVNAYSTHKATTCSTSSCH
jgi:hypothetical protein